MSQTCRLDCLFVASYNGPHADAGRAHRRHPRQAARRHRRVPGRARLRPHVHHRDLPPGRRVPRRPAAPLPDQGRPGVGGGRATSSSGGSRSSARSSRPCRTVPSASISPSTCCGPCSKATRSRPGSSSQRRPVPIPTSRRRCRRWRGPWASASATSGSSCSPAAGLSTHPDRVRVSAALSLHRARRPCHASTDARRDDRRRGRARAQRRQVPRCQQPALRTGGSSMTAITTTHRSTKRSRPTRRSSTRWSPD